MKALLDAISREVTEVLAHVSEEEFLAFGASLRKAERIFVAGEGRSGLMGKAFAMRLMHAGYDAFAVGETITPSIGPADVLVAISGSGTTETVHLYASQARKSGASVLLVTTNRHSKIAEYSDGTLRIPAATKKRLEDEPPTIQPLGNQFDQCLHLLLDAVVIHLLSESNRHGDRELAQRHSNLQ
ncbi:6-phospho-3-hexuloisomerase [Paenibacillus ginsengihumi]|uniref:6-phospho-3-hexuloisomerase n=1 Tax=Paenibacillus ginsengihumi TaxID=431596 RepID=UPI000477A951|nr:6-phospho-3-hexuloisomerase [Paenibacillus ginsengihumi]